MMEGRFIDRLISRGGVKDSRFAMKQDKNFHRFHLLINTSKSSPPTRHSVLEAAHEGKKKYPTAMGKKRERESVR